MFSFSVVELRGARLLVKPNMPSDDNQIVVNLIMIELLGTIFFLAIVTICFYIKRLFVRKSLNGFKILVKWKALPLFIRNLKCLSSISKLCIFMSDSVTKPIHSIADTHAQIWIFDSILDYKWWYRSISSVGRAAIIATQMPCHFGEGKTCERNQK